MVVADIAENRVRNARRVGEVNSANSKYLSVCGQEDFLLRRFAVSSFAILRKINRLGEVGL